MALSLSSSSSSMALEGNAMTSPSNELVLASSVGNGATSPAETMGDWLGSLSAIAHASNEPIHVPHGYHHNNNNNNNNNNTMNIEGGGSHSGSTTAAAAADTSAPDLLGQRGLAFIEAHLSSYDSRLRSLTESAEEYRYGRLYLYAGNIGAASSSLAPSLIQVQRELAAITAQRKCWLLLFHLRRCEDSVIIREHEKEEKERNNIHTNNTTILSVTDSNHDARRGEFSHSSLAQQALLSSSEVSRMQCIVDWLEELREERIHIDVNTKADYHRTIQQSQNALITPNRNQLAPPTSIDALPRIDPDGPLRDSASNRGPMSSSMSNMSSQYNDLDIQDEQRLLSFIFRFLRAGRLLEAISLCRQFGQPWRAASLNGGRFYNDEKLIRNDDGGMGKYNDETVGVSGNKHRFAWKESCIRLSVSSRISACEQAIYGLLGGYIPSVMNYINDYEDALWVYFKHAVHYNVDKQIITNIHPHYIHSSTIHKEYSNYQNYLNQQLIKNNPSTNIHNAHALTPIDIFNQFNEKHPLLQEKIRLSSLDPYHAIQKALILNDIGLFEQTVQRYICHYYPLYAPLFNNNQTNEESDSGSSVNANNMDNDYSYLLFAVHLYLYLHPHILPLHSPLSSSFSIALFSSLIRHLTHLKLYTLIAIYASYLPESQRVYEYSRFLNSIVDVEERKHYLNVVKQFFPDSLLSITKMHVESVLQQEAGAGTRDSMGMEMKQQQRGVGGVRESEAQISATDMEKIRSLECFDLNAHTDFAQFREAMTQTNILFRTFISTDRMSAAKYLSEQMTAKLTSRPSSPTHLDHYSYTASDLGAAQADEWRKCKMEFENWRAVVTAHKWLAVWSAHQRNRPSPSSSSSLSSSSSAAAAADSASSVSGWQSKENEILKACWKSFELALTSHGSLLSFHTHPHSPSLLPFAYQLRHTVIPTLIFNLFHISYTSKRAEQCMMIADLVADERYKLYDAFNGDELAAFLRKIRNSIVEIELTNSSSTWLINNSSGSSRGGGGGGGAAAAAGSHSSSAAASGGAAHRNEMEVEGHR